MINNMTWASAQTAVQNDIANKAFGSWYLYHPRITKPYLQLALGIYTTDVVKLPRVRGAKVGMTKAQLLLIFKKHYKNSHALEGGVSSSSHVSSAPAQSGNGISMAIHCLGAIIVGIIVTAGII